MATMAGLMIEMIGERFRKANQGIADLKTHVMGMEYQINERFGGIDTRLNGVDNRLDNIKTLLGKIAAHLGIQ